MTNPPSGRCDARGDPDFLAYRHLCIVLAVPGFSADERAALAATVAAEAPAFDRLGVDLEAIESPGRPRAAWAGLCFAPGTGREAGDTLVAVYSRLGPVRILLDLHRGPHCMPDREPDPGSSAAELAAGLLFTLRDLLEHPAVPLPIRGNPDDSCR